MPGAKCYACMIKDAVLPSTLGNPDEPIGACDNCSAFICGHHGYRDKGKPRFECRMCYPKLLAASAANIGGQASGGMSNSIIRRLLRLHKPRIFTLSNEISSYLFSISEFYESFPFYKEYLQTELAATRLEFDDKSQDLEYTINDFPQNARTMIHAAAILVKQTMDYVPPTSYKEPTIYITELNSDNNSAFSHYPEILQLIAKAVKPKEGELY